MPGGLQVPESIRQRMVDEIDRIVSSTSQSNMPSIYGMAAAAEVKRLRPVSSSVSEVLASCSFRISSLVSLYMLTLSHTFCGISLVLHMEYVSCIHLRVISLVTNLKACKVSPLCVTHIISQFRRVVCYHRMAIAAYASGLE